MNFNTMTAGEISAELERFQLQIMNQQAHGQPMTDAQRKRLRLLQKIYTKQQQILAK